MNSTTLTYVPEQAQQELLVFGVRVTILAEASTTDGAMTVSRITCDPGQGSPPHRHGQAEAFAVMAGSMELLAEGSWTTLRAGDFARVSPHAVHAFRNNTNEPAIMLNVATPAGHEEFFRQADSLFRSGRFTPETAASVCAATGIELV